jgi:hypothetical protein
MSISKSHRVHAVCLDEGRHLMAATPRSVPRKAPGLLTRDLGTEIVVIDPATDQAHSLAGLTADVWRYLDADRLPQAPEAEVAKALAVLRESGLLQVETGLSRRALLQRAGTVAVAGTVITIAMPEVMAAASTTPPAVTTATLDPDTTVKPSTQFTLNATVIADDGTIPAGTFKVTDPYKISGANGTSLPADGAGMATFTFTSPATPPSPNSELFTLTFTPINTLTYTSSTDSATVIFAAAQITKTTPTITNTTPTKTHNVAWPLTVTVTGSGGHTPTGTIAVVSGNTNATVTTVNATLTGTGNAATATFNVKNVNKKNRSASLKITYTPAPTEQWYNGTSKTVTYKTT